MLTKIIFTAPGGKLVVTPDPQWKKYFRGVKINGVRPHLIQIFGEDFDNDDRKDIFMSLNKSKHPQCGRITVNGKFVTDRTIL